MQLRQGCLPVQRSIPNLPVPTDRKSTRLNSSHGYISYAVFCLKKKRGPGGRRAARRVAAGCAGGRAEGAGAGRTRPGARLWAGGKGVGGPVRSSFPFFNDTATTEIYPLSLHDALPI